MYIDFLFFGNVIIAVAINIFLIGIMMIGMGLLALYVERIHDEVIDRPLYIVKDKLNLDK